MPKLTDEKIESVIESLGISTLKQWKALDKDMLFELGIPYHHIPKSSQVRMVLRRLNPPNEKRRRQRIKKERAYPRF